jgi:O-antigen/teichoic acid export membrane protein
MLGVTVHKAAAKLRKVTGPTAAQSGSAKDRGQERIRRALLASLTAAFNRFIGLIAALISVPLTLKYLEPEAYGVWLALSGISAMLTFADLGMGNGLLNAVATAFGSDDRPAMKRAVASAFFMLLGICVAGSAVAFMSIHWLPISQWLGVHSESTKEQVFPAILILVSCFALNLPLDVVQRVQAGLQCSFQSNIWRGAGNAASLIALLVFMYAQLGLPWLVLALYGVPLLLTTANFVSFFCWERRDLRPTLGWFDFNLSKRMIREGVLFLIAQTGSSTLTAAPVLFSANLFGAQAAAEVGITQRLFLIPYALCEFFWAPLWPAYGEAWSRGDYDWIRKTIQRTTVWIVLGMAAMTFPLSAAAPVLIRQWSGAHIEIGTSLGFATGFLMLVRVARGILSMPVNGCGFIKKSAVLFGVAALVICNAPRFIRGMGSPSSLVSAIAIVELIIVTGMLIDVRAIMGTSNSREMEGTIAI